MGVESKDAGSYRLLPVVHSTELLALIYQRLLFLFCYATYQLHWGEVIQLASETSGKLGRGQSGAGRVKRERRLPYLAADVAAQVAPPAPLLETPLPRLNSETQQV